MREKASAEQALVKEGNHYEEEPPRNAAYASVWGGNLPPRLKTANEPRPLL